MDAETSISADVAGRFVDLAGERYYQIRHCDRLPPFFITVISGSDHWLFLSSTGGVTAGRVSSEQALFPYVPVDQIHDSTHHTGSRTIIRVAGDSGQAFWQPFNREQDGRYRLSRNLYKNVLGNKLCFEEVNHDLALEFRCTWTTSEAYGFIRQCELRNLGSDRCQVEVLDGLQNILPAGTPSHTQTQASNLVDAYKWTELHEDSRLASYSLYSGISDRAEPSESLRANTVFSLGLEHGAVLLSTTQVEAFLRGGPVTQESHKRGIRGAYFVVADLSLAANEARRWSVVADVEQTQSRVVERLRELGDPSVVEERIAQSVEEGSDEVSRIVAMVDGFQATDEETVAVHHYANALFNVLRGGVFDDQYKIRRADLNRTIAHFNRNAHARHRAWLEDLPETIDLSELLAEARKRGDPQLERICREYLPITFGRRHGDPSRPWNRFEIKVRDAQGRRLLNYEGNWRDIFQNWEALALSFPEFTESFIARFINASTADGYNPYRITKDGIDWEVEDPHDPWSHIGYWGDHQIIYLLKLLELSARFHPGQLQRMLRRPVFSYANVPYRLKCFDAILRDPKHTVDYDHSLAEGIANRVAEYGADGRLVPDDAGSVYLVNLMEKLLVPLLCKLGNLVPEGGIWLTTQRPEWNDANNALVGHGLSVVTLCYLRRYVCFLQQMLSGESGGFALTGQVTRWLSETREALVGLQNLLDSGPLDDRQRLEALSALGLAASRYRESVYASGSLSQQAEVSIEEITGLLDTALGVIDHSVRANLREDGLYHAYNLLQLEEGGAGVAPLYPMLEGQVAILSAGAIGPAEAARLLESLFDSDIYRDDQRSFMLYPDRDVPGFLDKNRIPEARIHAIDALRKLVADGDEQLVSRDVDGVYRFSADFRNATDLKARLNELIEPTGDLTATDRQAILDLYEETFNHRAFTGRSGSMFGFEGLGCIYWHMVAKLLLAVQEQYFGALDRGTDKTTCSRLGALYYRVRAGLGFNKSPSEYGAFPTDPYSHTPKHAGAQQPGMTGQVKEEVLTRFGELGVRVSGGALAFDPRLLRRREFLSGRGCLRYLDLNGRWRDLEVPERALAFSWCQVPIVYRLTDRQTPTLRMAMADGEDISQECLSVSPELSSSVFKRDGRVRRITVDLPTDLLFDE